MIKIRCRYCGALHERGEKCPCSRSRQQKHNEKTKCYTTARWLKCRAAVIKQLAGIDVYEFAKTGRLVPLTDDIIVHHIVERDEDYDLFYTSENLVTMSLYSHNDLHANHYNKSAEEKEKWQNILRFARSEILRILAGDIPW